MELDDKQLSRLKQLLTLLEPDVLTKEDFKTNFKAVVDFVKKIEKKNLDDFKGINEMITKLSEKMRTDNESGFGSLQEEIKKAVSDQIAKLTEQFEMKKYEIDAKILSIKDGKDADEKRVIETVVKQIKVPEIKEIENNLPQLGTRIRDGLELLQGDDRLDASAIKGLEIKGKEVKIVGGVGGGRGMYVYIDGVKKGLLNTLNLVPGTNVTFSYNRSNGRNDLTISASGAALSILAATGDVDNSNTTFTFISEPNLVIVNRATYRDGHGCSISGTDVTLDNPVGLNGDIYGLG